MGLYDKRGYLNIPSILNYNVAFNYVWGGRGTGKTYGALKYCIENNKKFVYMRSLQTQLDCIKKEELSPFKSINRDMGIDIKPKSITKNLSAFYYTELKNDKVYFDGEPKGYAMALSTVANLRGFDASDVEILIYDEFIPEKRERKVESAGYSFKNAYETMNRNRELNGIKPIQCLLFSNSENLACDIFIENGLMNKVNNMDINKQEMSIIKERSIGLFNLCNSPISKEKEKTTLYIMSGKDSDFSRMAIGNEFYNTDRTSIRKVKLIEYKPICKVDAITIYEHKSNNMLYVSAICLGKCKEFSKSVKDLKAFRKYYSWIYEEYLLDNVEFQDITCKSLLEIYFKEKF